MIVSKLKQVFSRGPGRSRGIVTSKQEGAKGGDGSAARWQRLR